MMKNRLILLMLSFFLLGSNMGLADTCPRAQDLDLTQPPAGWTYWIGPDWISKNYTFSSAIHFLGSFCHEQIVCRYEACSSYFCSAFTLISNQTYQEPSEARAPWNHRSVLRYTLTCMPADHDPAHCVFQ